jgi:hypothetical protein
LARKLGSKGPSLSRVSRLLESLVWGQVNEQYGGPTTKLIVDWDIGAPWLAKRRGVFNLVIHIRIVGSFQGGMRDVTEKMSSYSLHLAKNNTEKALAAECDSRVMAGVSGGLESRRLSSRVFG